MNIIQAYPTLGVHQSSTDAEIKAAHKRLSMQLHPDRDNSDAIKFMEVQQAYRTLKGVSPLYRIKSLKFLGNPCASCDGLGTKRQQRGFKTVSISPCKFCGGSGYVER